MTKVKEWPSVNGGLHLEEAKERGLLGRVKDWLLGSKEIFLANLLLSPITHLPRLPPDAAH